MLVRLYEQALQMRALRCVEAGMVSTRGGDRVEPGTQSLPGSTTLVPSPFSLGSARVGHEPEAQAASLRA